LASLEGIVITMKSNQKKAKRCYENNLKTKRGVCSVTTQPPREEEVAREQRPKPVEEVLEREIRVDSSRSPTWEWECEETTLTS